MPLDSLLLEVEKSQWLRMKAKRKWLWQWFINHYSAGTIMTLDILNGSCFIFTTFLIWVDYLSQKHNLLGERERARMDIVLFPKKKHRNNCNTVECWMWSVFAIFDKRRKQIFLHCRTSIRLLIQPCMENNAEDILKRNPKIEKRKKKKEKRKKKKN